MNGYLLFPLIYHHYAPSYALFYFYNLNQSLVFLHIKEQSQSHPW